MYHFIQAAAALAATSLLISCESHETLTSSVAENRASAVAPSSYALRANAGVEDLVALALERHPSIDAAEAKVRRLLARVPQAKALPDPKARVSFGSMAETAAGRIDAMAGVEQALPFPGKLRAMAKAVGKEAEAAAAELELARLDLAEQVRSAYWSYYLAKRATAINGESRGALAQVRDSVDARVAANQAGQDDQLRMATEFGKLEGSLIEERRGEVSAKARLNALLDRPRGEALPAPRADAAGRRGELSALLAAAERDHPSVRAAQAQLAAFEHRLERAKLDAYPDFNVGVQYAAVSDSGLAPSANGRDQAFATFGVSIPLWQGARKARLKEARAGMDESGARVGAARSKLRFQVEDAWLRVKSSEQLITLYEKQILPEAEQAFEVVLAGYSAGTLSFVDVLDAWRSHLELQLQQAGNRAGYGKAIAALRSASGS
jgi:cobalt-zinc-cadmium efflux system outer membrane protein